ncbi:MAG: response regulator, partial [Nitrosopumilus sp.]|nr:response regulator [Nitrosopumilus sp.]
MKIMIIDNDHDFGSVFARLLRIKGFDVTLKTNLKAGLSYFKNKTCHVLFIDIPLVGYDIKQILYLLEENHLFQKSNIFLFSSIDLDTDELNEWKKHGLYSYLKKPIKRDTILNALNDVYTKMTLTTYENTVESYIDDD